MTRLNPRLRTFVVDDELLAIKRLTKLLAGIDNVEVIGSTTDPAAAVTFLSSEDVDVPFLDIQMPALNGFELLSRLDRQPMVIFTTAYERYALKAFEVNSIDYLLKPVQPAQLERAIRKLQRLREAGKALETRFQLQPLVSKLADSFPVGTSATPDRIGTRLGNRILLLDLNNITHFVSEDKLTFASTTEGKCYIVENTLTELEQKLKGFARIHRATLVNLSYVDELYRWFAGRMRLRLRDKPNTELTVSRNQVALLKARLGL